MSTIDVSRNSTHITDTTYVFAGDYFALILLNDVHKVVQIPQEGVLVLLHL